MQQSLRRPAALYQGKKVIRVIYRCSGEPVSVAENSGLLTYQMNPPAYDVPPTPYGEVDAFPAPDWNGGVLEGADMVERKVATDTPVANGYEAAATATQPPAALVLGQAGAWTQRSGGH